MKYSVLQPSNKRKKHFVKKKFFPLRAFDQSVVLIYNTQSHPLTDTDADRTLATQSTCSASHEFYMEFQSTLCAVRLDKQETGKVRFDLIRKIEAKLYPIEHDQQFLQTPHKAFRLHTFICLNTWHS